MRTINTAIEKTSSTNPLCPLSMPGATWASVAAEGVFVGLAFFFFFWLFFPPQAVGVFCHSGSFTINAKKTPTTPSPVNNKQKRVVDMEREMPREAARMRAPAMPFAIWTTSGKGAKSAARAGSRGGNAKVSEQPREGREEGIPLLQGRIRLHTASAGRRGNV